jgi:hypothetical protein
MRIKKRNAVELIILIALLATPSLAASAEEKTLPSSQPGTLTFKGPVRFGQRDLPAGAYEFRCVHRGTSHLMTVYRVSSDTSGRVFALGQPVASDYCRMEDLAEKVKVSSAHTKNDVSGKSVIHELRLEGDQVRHIFGEVLGFDRIDGS